MEKIKFVLVVMSFAGLSGFAQRIGPGQSTTEKHEGKLIYTADFNKKINKHEWITEIQSQSDDEVYTKNGMLVMNTKGGVTVWLNKRLEGNIQIEYKRSVVVAGNENDRLSDLNQFWMAEDPRNSNLFTRNGVFSEYDSLRLYYVGMGGNTNTTTRFRKYHGDGEKPLLQEHNDEGHLLKAGKKYSIKIIVRDGTTSFWVDGECYFTFRDPAPLRGGYFGFRSVHSHQQIEDFRIYQLP